MNPIQKSVLSSEVIRSAKSYNLTAQNCHGTEGEVNTHALSTRPPPHHLLSQDGEWPFMRSKPKHNQVRVQPMQDMMLIRIVSRLSPLPPYKVHDLVLSLSGLTSIRKNYLSMSCRGHRVTQSLLIEEASTSHEIPILPIHLHSHVFFMSWSLLFTIYWINFTKRFRFELCRRSPKYFGVTTQCTVGSTPHTLMPCHALSRFTLSCT